MLNKSTDQRFVELGNFWSSQIHPTFCRPPMLITGFTRANNLSESWARFIQTAPSCSWTSQVEIPFNIWGWKCPKIRVSQYWQSGIHRCSCVPHHKLRQTHNFWSCNFLCLVVTFMLFFPRNKTFRTSCLEELEICFWQIEWTLNLQ